MYLIEYQFIKYVNSFKANYDKNLEVLLLVTKREQFLKYKMR